MSHLPDMSEKRAFLRSIALSDAVTSSLRRGYVFCTADEDKRLKVRKDLAQRLVCIAQDYEEGGVTDDAHVDTLVQLAECMTEDHKSALRDHHFRLGTAQKALNLYLKHAWLYNWICTPPHCPFDRVILQPLFPKPKASGLCCPNGHNWTQMDCSACYLTWVREARASMHRHARPSLADWELWEWNRKSGNYMLELEVRST